jgi:hypothetical protein
VGGVTNAPSVFGWVQADNRKARQSVKVGMKNVRKIIFLKVEVKEKMFPKKRAYKI